MRFGAMSLSELQGVRAELVLCAANAMARCTQRNLDFSVFDGLRTIAEQRKNIRRGVSWTMNSMHLPQEDGFSWAVDLVPYVQGRIRWDDPDPAIQSIIDQTYECIAVAVDESCKTHGFIVDWGYDLWGKDKPHFQFRKE